MLGTASISGVISGLKTDEIITKMMQLERVPITRMETQKAILGLKMSAWQEMNTRVLALKDKADALVNPTTFQTKDFITSDSSILTGSASASAQSGTYYLRVTQLATTHQLKTDGYADIDGTSVGTGTIQISVGSGDAKNITIDESNNTLIGMRDAINRANVGVNATIVNDGAAENAYRLVITSKTGGTAGEITITNDLSGGQGLNVTEMQAARNASVTLGEGPGALVIESGSNTLSSAIPGVTLNLREANVDRTISITIENDTAAVKKAITDFVNQYNHLVEYSNAQFKFDPETKNMGTLFGDWSLRHLMSELRSKISNPINELNQDIKVLSQIGITSTMDNKLVINETRLSEALTDNLDSVRKLFSTVGDATNGSVTYIHSTSNTKPSGVDGYEVVITTAATQARVTAGVAQTTALTQDETLTINGFSIELTAGMTQADIIEKINQHSNQTGVAASSTNGSGSDTGDYLTLQRMGYGSAHGITVVSTLSNGGVPDTSGFGTTTVTAADPGGESGSGTGVEGVDVAGTINGEPATGLGQLLTGNTGNANTEGLRIRVTAGDVGHYGYIHFTKGVAGLTSEYVSFVTDSLGTVRSAQNGLQDRINFFNNRIADMESRLAVREERLLRQFAAMEAALNQLHSQGSYMMQQAQQAQNNWK